MPDRVADKSSIEEELRAKNKEILHLTEKLAEQTKEAQHSFKIQQALYRISELASGAEELNQFYNSVHQIISQLFYADNFYIGIVNEQSTALDLIYFVDSKDHYVPHEDNLFSIDLSELTLSTYLYQQRKTLLLSTNEMVKLYETHSIKSLGPSAYSWLGAPLVGDNGILGIIVVQSYTDEFSYKSWHKELFDYVSHAIASALHRRKTKDNLEKLVQERTVNLVQEMEDHKKSRETQSALYQIANLTSMDIGLIEFYKELHKIIAQLVYAENFYIALRDSENDAIEMVYYVDTMDDLDLESIASIPLESLRKSVTVYVMNSAIPLLANKQQMAAITQKENLEVHGEQTSSWLGIPLEIDGNVIGIMTIQSYIENKQMSEKDKELMIFVGQHVATALSRNKNKDYLKLLVEKRTKELMVSNQRLHNEISQRKYSEKIQTALFRISKTPQHCNSDKEHYARLHEIIAKLMYAKNFYITMVDQENQCFNFDYVIDDVDKSVPESISIGKSLTSYVYHQKKIVHFSRSDIIRMEKAGKIENRGSYPIDWVGVPLLAGTTIFGILIIQSYDHNHIYSERDIEVLNFVSTHIADALDRTRAKKKLEFVHQELAEKSRKAEAASEAKSSFLATVSHEIRTPMNGVLGILSLLAETRMTQKQQDYVSKISISANSLLGIINNILDYSKIEKGKLILDVAAFKLLDLLDNMVDIFSASIIEKRLNFTIDVEPQVNLSRIGDSLRLSQILINLIGNAIKFTEKGFVKVTVKAPSTKRLLFLVEDTGIGIHKDKINKIFSSFTQADDTTTRKFGGSGLGLSICQQLVSMMDGWIKVSSVLGQGSCFSFEITINREKEHLPAGKSYSGIRVLLISNNDQQKQSWFHLFEKFEINLTCMTQRQFNHVESNKIENVTHLFIDSSGRELETNSSSPLLLQSSLRCYMLFQPGPVKQESPNLHQNIQVIPKPTKMNLILDLIRTQPEHSNIGKSKIKANKKTRQKMLDCKVLVAEDNLINQQVAREILKQAGAIVTLVDNGKLAVEKCKSSHFDIVLMDMQMPIMDGYQATVQIRKNLSPTQLPIIAMTANVMKGDREKCLQHGMNDYIGKPINRATFFTTIEKHLFDKD